MRIWLSVALYVVWGLAASAGTGDVAIIVNKHNATTNVTGQDLVKLFKQETLQWKNHQRVYLLMMEEKTPEKELVLKRIYEMNDEALKKFWLGKLFRGEIESFPQTLGSGLSVQRFVSQVPNAIGFVDASIVDDTVNLLTVDGKRPGEPGYILNKTDEKPPPGGG